MSEADHCEVCIVGTGAGGGILAHQLAQAGFRVVSLEQGRMLETDHFARIDPPGAKLDFGIRDNSVWPSEPHDSLFVHPLFARQDTRSSTTSTQFQQYQILAVNGLQNLWNGVSVRFAASDFDGWPIGYDDLAPHYTAVEKLITVCGTEEGLDALPDGAYVPPKPLRLADLLIMKAVDGLGETGARAIPNRKAIETRPGLATSCISCGICTSGCPVGSVYKFSARLLPEIAKLPNYELRSNAKVVRLLRAPGATKVDGVEYIDTATGELRRLRADRVVLAAGAIESPRILFNSADEADPAGLGNRSGHVGMWLQDNPKSVLSTSLWRLWGKRPSPDIGYGDLLILMARGKLPDGAEFPFIGHAIHGTPEVPHYLGGMSFIPPFAKPTVARMMFNSYVTLGLFSAGEPLPGNRIRPAAATDRYGVPQVSVDFAASPRAHATMDAMDAWGRRVLRAASSTLVHATRDASGTGIHYAGTTRMSANPAEGVVDAGLRCHGFENLHVCDGSVIPQLPDKHLTLTIMALAHRLAGQLRAARNMPAEATA